MPTQIGTVTFTDTEGIKIQVSYEYYRTKGDFVIGGKRVFNISGTTTASFNGSTGATVMSRLKEIRNLGSSGNISCIPVVLDNFYTGQARVVDIKILEGNDPAWVNAGEFNIILEAPLADIPRNNFGILVTDNVVELQRTETLALGEESHGYIYVGQTTFSKSFAKYSSRTTIRCESLCGGPAVRKAEDVLKRIAYLKPTSELFDNYKTWKPYNQSRTLEYGLDGSITLSVDTILVPSGDNIPVDYAALIDLNFESENDYNENSSTFKVNGQITGLAPIEWFDIMTPPSQLQESKINGANKAFLSIKQVYNTIKAWVGLQLQLTLLPGCPNPNQVGNCGVSNVLLSNCIYPSNSQSVKSLTNGTIDFSVEWTSKSGECVGGDGLRVNTNVEVSDREPQFQEHIVPRVGHIIQDLRCKRRARFSITTTLEGQNTCQVSTQGITRASTSHTTIRANTLQQLNQTYQKSFVKIAHTETQTMTNYVIKEDFVEAC